MRATSRLRGYPGQYATFDVRAKCYHIGNKHQRLHVLIVNSRRYRNQIDRFYVLRSGFAVFRVYPNECSKLAIAHSHSVRTNSRCAKGRCDTNDIRISRCGG
jgi:hypothetical protein